MRQLTVVALLILSLIAGAIGIAQAQTPEPEAAEAPATSQEIPGASVDVLAESMSDDGTVGGALYRITLEPGAEVPDHEHFGSVTWYVTSGEVTVTVVDGEVWVHCAGCLPDDIGDTPRTPNGDVLVPVGTEVTLQPGDRMFQHAFSVHNYRSTGDEPAVIEASTTYSTEGGEATPAAGGPHYTIKGCRGGCF